MYSVDRIVLTEFGMNDKQINKRIGRTLYIYWHLNLNVRFDDQVMTRADLGLARAYIDGDFSCSDKNDDLLNLFMVR